jgi:glycosyltransferase involved in cell wall biosynthesis
LFSFLFRSFWILSKRHLQRPYDVIHVHSIPDFEVFAALVPKLLGAKVVLDIYDVLPEFYLSKFRATVRSPVYRLLLWQERLSARFAHHVISANHIWQKKLTARAVPESRCTPFINYIDTRLFCQRTRQRQDSRCRVIYPGVLNWHQGVDICVRAFQIFLEKVPDSEFYIYGEGSEKTALTQLITHLGLTASVFFKKPIPLSEIPQLLADSDIGLVGKRADVFGNEAYSTKILEYMSQGIPAIVPRTAIDAFYFNDSVVAFYDPGNPQDMAAQMLRVYGDAELRSTLVRNGLDYVKTNSWDSVFRNYLALIDRLVGR